MKISSTTPVRQLYHPARLILQETFNTKTRADQEGKARDYSSNCYTFILVPSDSHQFQAKSTRDSNLKHLSLADLITATYTPYQSKPPSSAASLKSHQQKPQIIPFGAACSKTHRGLLNIALVLGFGSNPSVKLSCKLGRSLHRAALKHGAAASTYLEHQAQFSELLSPSQKGHQKIQCGCIPPLTLSLSLITHKKINHKLNTTIKC